MNKLNFETISIKRILQGYYTNSNWFKKGKQIQKYLHHMPIEFLKNMSADYLDLIHVKDNTFEPIKRERE